jgi:acyl-CoA hydrolase
MTNQSGKSPRESQIEQVHIVQYQHLNASDRLFGGQSMVWMDYVAGNVARRHTRCQVTTATLDSLVFYPPAYLGDQIIFTGRVTYTGRTSLEVQVTAEAENRGDSLALLQKAYFVLVALDDDKKPAPVTPLIVETEEDAELWAAAEKRKAFREQRRELGV